MKVSNSWIETRWKLARLRTPQGHSHYHPNGNNYKRKIRISGFWIFIHLDYLIPRFRRADLGWIFISAWQILGKLPANFSLNSMVKFFCETLGLVFSGLEAPQKISRPRLTHAQTCRHSSPISHVLAHFFHDDFLLTGETKITKANAKKTTLGLLHNFRNSGLLLQLFFVCVCGSTMFIMKAYAKENPGQTICTSITKAGAT